MQTILLRDIVLNEGSAFRPDHVRIDSYTARAFLKGDVGDWLLKNGIEPLTESFHDVSTRSVHFRIYARVSNSLATYYYLRWGKPVQERVYT